MHIVSSLTGDEWAKLGRRLFKDQDVLRTEKNIIQNCDLKPNLYDKCYAMLLEWVMQSHSPNRENLIDAVRDLKWENIAQRLERERSTTLGLLIFTQCIYFEFFLVLLTSLQLLLL